MREIWVSNTAGRKPSVNQLELAVSNLGFNRVDCLFYGLKMHGDGSKSVECLGESLTPGSTHDRLHAMFSADDHAPATGTNRGKIPYSDPVTGIWSGIELPDPGTGGETIRIPQLKLAFGCEKESGVFQHDVIRANWESENVQFLDLNPEIWMFRYKPIVRRINPVFITNLTEVCPNVTLDTADHWALTECTIADGVCHIETSESVEQLMICDYEVYPLTTYEVSFQIKNYVTGSITASIGGVSGTLRNPGPIPDSGDGFYVERIRALTNEGLKFSKPLHEDAKFDIDNISYKYVEVDYTRITRRNWRHEPHLNGIKYPGSNFYNGSIRCQCAEIEASGRKTEFGLTALTSQERQIIPIDVFDFYFNAADYSRIADDAALDLLNGNVSKAKGGWSKSIQLRFAIVIDNPDYTVGSALNPKLTGPLSDETTMRLVKLGTIPAHPSRNYYRVKFSRENQGIKLFGSGRLT